MKRYFIILLVFFSFVSQSQNLRKGAYIIYTNNINEMKILWQLDTTAQCSLKWGIDSLNLNNSIITTETGDTTNQHQHIYLITNLLSNQKYFYSLQTPNDTISSYFLSAQDTNNTETVFYAYGDTRSYPASQDSVCAAIIDDINTEPNSQTFLLHAGDWTGDDEETSWDTQFFNRSYPNNLLLQSKLPLMGCRGNHEEASIQYNKYWPYEYNYAGDYYSFDYGLVHISVVDLYVDFTTDSEQLIWLQNDLANSDKTWKFVMLHEPAYTDTSYHKNNVDVQDYILPVCQDNNVKLIFAGHNHYYAHCFVDNIHHLTLGGGGAPLYTANGVGEGVILSESTLHYAKISTTKTEAIIEVKRPDNTTIETFSLLVEVGINDINRINDYDVFTSNNLLMINQQKQERIDIAIYNSLGQTILTKVLHNTQNQINISDLDKGIYIVSIKNKDISFSKKIILN